MSNQRAQATDLMSRQIVLLVCLFTFVMTGCGRGPDRVVGETAEWSFEDYKKARDAEAVASEAANKAENKTKP